MAHPAQRGRPLENEMNGNIDVTTRLPITTVARKNGMHVESPTNMQSHIDSIHSPQRTRKTIINECIKSIKCHRGSSLSGNRSTLSIGLKI